jgi:hypothetical protein
MLPLRDHKRAFYSGPVLPGVLWTFDEELLGVYREHYLHRTARVEFFDGANRLAYGLGAYFHPVGSGFFVYLDENPNHPG